MTRLMGTVSAFALAAAPVLAQAAFELDEITVFAGFESVDVLDTGVSVDVITEETLQQTGETRVIDFLARQPSVTLRTNGPLGGVAGLSIRGVGQQNIAVRVDGIDVSDPTGPQVSFDFGGLMTTDISRIELLRGSQGAGFGSESIGGAINITTKRATRDGLAATAALEGGSFGTLKSALSLSNRGARHETNATLSYVKSDGFSAADEGDGFDEADGYEARRLSLTGRYLVGDAAVLSFAAFAENAEFDYDEAVGGLPIDGTPDEVTVREQRGLRLGLDITTGSVDHTFALSGFRMYRQLTGTNGFGPFELNYEGTRQQLTYTGGFDTSAAGRLVFGLERTIETYEDYSAFGSQNHDTHVTSAFAEFLYAPSSALDLSVALRHDDHSEYGGYWSGRLSAAYMAQDDLILRFNAATGYRAPSNYELFGDFVGDATLTPETSVSLDLGVEKRFASNGFLRATAFWVQARDLIDYSFTTFTYTQRDGTATRRGLELAGGVDLTPALRVTGAYTLTDSQSDVTLDSSGWQSIVPRHGLSLGLTADLSERATLSVTGLYEGNRVDLDNYGVVNTTLSYDLNDRFEGYVRVENLFDADYQTVPGYGTADRSAYVGIRASF